MVNETDNKAQKAVEPEIIDERGVNISRPAREGKTDGAEVSVKVYNGIIAIVLSFLLSVAIALFAIVIAIPVLIVKTIFGVFSKSSEN
ncbi:hypothetical protein Dip518_000490 [Parelusimicrobium proximum]|uniref:hypothetical protein n=1 Tax=Parelusimicrobium proximum TaxID=3228953 RepID=UPI003D169DCB